MPAFLAINVEPEDNVEDEADVTRRIQIDDALKLYQNALKLHAQGPRAFAAAEEAYTRLFQSDIFRYPEAKTEYERAETQADNALVPEPLYAGGLEAGVVLDDSSSGSTLPQAYFLAYKNHGQFLLDRIRHKARVKGKEKEKAEAERVKGKEKEKAEAEREQTDEDVFHAADVVGDAHEALDDFDAALDRDPSDADLWRRTARVAAFLRSSRIERYCLEAAIELDDDPAVVEVEPPSLAEGFAGEQLRRQLQALADDVALSHPIMAPFLRKQMAASLRRYLDPFPWMPYPAGGFSTARDAVAAAGGAGTAHGERLVLKLKRASWVELGMALVKLAEDVGLSGRLVTIDAPEMPDESLVMQIEIDQQLSVLAEATGDQPGGAVDGKEERAVPEPGKEAASGDDKAKAGKEAANGDDKAKAVDAGEAGDERDARRGSSVKERGSSQSRKRSQSAAGLPEGGGSRGGDEDGNNSHSHSHNNGDTKRSKRLRRRETLVEDMVDANTTFASQLQPLQEADERLFTLLPSLLAQFGVPPTPALDEVREAGRCSRSAEERVARLQSPAHRELRDALTAFKDERARILLSKKDTPALGLDAFLGRSKAAGQQRQAEVAAFDEKRGLHGLVTAVQAGWFTAQDVAYEWAVAASQSYAAAKWSEPMKTAVVQVLSRFDEALWERVEHELGQGQGEGGGRPASGLGKLHALVQMLFELYLDIYERITNPNSATDRATRLETKGRLNRWMDKASAVARAVAGCAARGGPGDERAEEERQRSELTRRFLWASVFSLTLQDNVTQEHILACWESLRHHLEQQAKQAEAEGGGHGDIRLPNNAVMPEVSYEAADREISSLTTMDFFLSLFRADKKDAAGIIDRLEPVLNPTSVCVVVEEAGGGTKRGQRECAVAECASPELRDLWKFLRGASTDVRLFLWTRLASAYKDIDYATKVFSCYLRCIELIMDDLDSAAYLAMPEPTRRQQFMHLLKVLDETLIQALHIAVNDASAFDIVDTAHLQASAAALARVNAMLHVASLQEDEVRVGMTAAASHSQTYHGFLNKLREMQARAWTLQYTVVKAGLREGGGEEAKDTAKDERKEEAKDTAKDAPPPSTPAQLAELIGAMHEVMGLRKFCKASNKVFLRTARAELLKRRNADTWERYLGQVLYDLHGLKLGLGAGSFEVEEHGCPAEKLERKNALALVDRVMALAGGVPMKELLKSDLKNTIEHMQQAIGQTKSTPQMIHNLRYFTEYLKRPIHPLRLVQAWRGHVQLDTVAASTPDTVLARNGWFFLMGMIALSKFKGVDLNRRQTPGATDDLRVGAQYLRLQLQLTPARWDAWFRLAECADYDLDELVLWTAEKMNKDRAELVKLQRSAIHCYTLAISYYWSSEAAVAEPDPKTGPTTDLPVAGRDRDRDLDALHDLYHNFGMRLYASSREPFAMEAFRHGDAERWFIAPDTHETYRKPQHGEMSAFRVWKYAAGLFRRALAHKRRDWKSAYMLSKCVWKMYQAEENAAAAPSKQISVDDVLAALEKAVEVVSLLPKPRHGQDPVLEPHYKMLSVVDKLVRRGDLDRQAAADLLLRQPYAYAPAPGASAGVGAGGGGKRASSEAAAAAVSVTTAAEWEDLVVKSLRHLRDKDKSNWQHRMVVRHARILFGDCDEEAEADAAPPDSPGKDHGRRLCRQDKARAAFAVLRESMFTKTMVMNVWKCDAERPGRHHVYTEQYIRFMTRLLVVMEDRANLEALLRRIRKKGADFYHFNDLWQTCVTSYLRLLRTTFAIPAAAVDDAFFKSVAPEEFEILSERITEWVARAGATETEAEAEAEGGGGPGTSTESGMGAKEAAEDPVERAAAEAVVAQADGNADGLDQQGENGADREETNAAKTKGAAANALPPTDHRALRAMREAIELKKLNGNLMRAGAIDDLISDCYSVLYAEVSHSLPGEDPAKIVAERHRQLREEADRVAEKERERKREAEAEASTTAAMMLTFNLLSDRSGGAAGDAGAHNRSRAGSEVPGSGGGGSGAAEKMERSGSGMGGGGGDHPVRRGRVPAIRRPDVLRKAEQAIAKLGDRQAAPAATAVGGGGGGGGGGGTAAGTCAGAAAAGGGGGGSGGHGGNASALGSGGAASEKAGNGHGTTAAAGPLARGDSAVGRRSSRLGSAPSGKAEGTRGVGGGGGDGSRGGAEEAETASAGGQGGVSAQTKTAATATARNTRRKSWRYSDDADGDTEMKDVGEAEAGHADNVDNASSPGGSVHDSADDESELSDVPPDYEDNVPASLLMLLPPSGLTAAPSGSGTGAATPATPATEAEDDDEEEDDEDEDEEGEGETTMAENRDDGDEEEGETMAENRDEEDEGETMAENRDEDEGETMAENRDEEDEGETMAENRDDEDEGETMAENRDDGDEDEDVDMEDPDVTSLAGESA